MTKALYPSPGQLVLYCKVMSRVNRRTFVTMEEGTNSMRHVSREYTNAKIIRNAKLNAVYKHANRGGSVSGAVVEVMDFDFNYYDNFVERKKVLRYDKRTKKKEYWSEVRNKRTNKLIGRKKWTTAKKI